MSLISRVSRFVLIAVPLFCGTLSCGGTSTNNDQGTSFLAFGWSSDGEDTNLTGIIVPLASDQANFTNTEGGQFDGKTAVVFMGLQNRLVNQFLRVVRIDCRYDVQGINGLLTLPQDSYNSSWVLGPVAIDSENFDPSPGATIESENVANEAFLQFEVLSPDVYSFLNVYRNFLPQLPFRMTATCHAVGVTQAGDSIESNDLNLFIQFVDSAECCTGANGEIIGVNGGFQVGTGNGGGIVFEDGSTSTEVTTGNATLTGNASATTNAATTDSADEEGATGTN